jgi:putative endonuclease
VAIHNQRFGRRGEDAAAEWYRNAGYRIVDRNWRCPRGEIDLVVVDDNTVVFVEVKARTSGRYGSGFDAVDHRKQRRLRRLAALWLADRRSDRGEAGFYPDLQFDVVEVDPRGNLRIRRGCF